MVELDPRQQAVEPSQQPFTSEQIAAMNPRELILNNVETQRLVEDLDISSVITDHQLIEPSHAKELGDNMQTSTRGQISAIVVRARLDDETGEVVHDVIDGFHRTEGRRRIGAKTIKANVLYGCSDEEMNDLRILAASSVKSVKFARQIKWVTEAFSSTQWAEKGLTVQQAFGITVNDVSRSNTINLPPDEMQALKEWVRSKAVRWEKSLNTIYQELRLAGLSAPDLVERVRTATGGSSREVTITQAKLATVVNAFPGEQYWDLQRVILDFATSVDKKLKIDEIKAITSSVKIQDDMTPGDYFLAVTDAYHALKSKSASREKQNGHISESFVPEDEIPETAELFSRSSDEVLPDDELQLDAEEPPIEALLAIEKATQPEKVEVKAPLSKPQTTTVFEDNGSSGMRTGGYSLGERTTDQIYQKKIADLQDALDKANQKNRNGHENGDWWQTAAYLEPYEREAMTAFCGLQSLVDLAEKMRVTENQLLLFIRSAIAKHRNVDKKNGRFPHELFLEPQS